MLVASLTQASAAELMITISGAMSAIILTVWYGNQLEVITVPKCHQHVLLDSTSLAIPSLLN